jgi:hypothetical protein
LWELIGGTVMASCRVFVGGLLQIGMKMLHLSLVLNNLFVVCSFYLILIINIIVYLSVVFDLLGLSFLSFVLELVD